MWRPSPHAPCRSGTPSVFVVKPPAEVLAPIVRRCWLGLVVLPFGSGSRSSPWSGRGSCRRSAFSPVVLGFGLRQYAELVLGVVAAVLRGCGRVRVYCDALCARSVAVRLLPRSGRRSKGSCAYRCICQCVHSDPHSWSLPRCTASRCASESPRLCA